MTPERFVCIHGHFYQPPRENPWLEAIEIQDSAYPNHDWNERVNAECYAPNTASPILDAQNRVVERVNNYAHISFNVGPTLLAWMERKARAVYEAILGADQESRRCFSGHGSAMAQAYNHVIMPLANRRDKRTQVLWGVRDFQHRFARLPEGMWLSETAVDVATLEELAQAGIRFTVLAPRQAKRLRPFGGQWEDVSGERVDTSRAYLQRLPSGGTMAVFFYNGPLSQAVAFEGLLHRGENLADRLTGGFNDRRAGPQLVHVATDGESYGHHHRFGDMALASALKAIREKGQVRLTNYGEFLDRHPPTHEVEVIENTSWSCVHGVMRWRAHCGCGPGAHPGWSQAWRAPLRESLDWLRDGLADGFQKRGGDLFRDPWAARDGYIDVVLDRSPESVERFLAVHASHPLTADERVEALKLLEMQRHAMLMYTSCGWFFDDLARIETVQVLRYAARAIQLGESLFDQGIERPFLERLERATSNVARYGNGRDVYDRFVRPSIIGFQEVAAHYAVTSLYQDDLPSARAGGDREAGAHRDSVHCYSVSRESFQRLESDRAQAVVGRIAVRSDITGESACLDMAALAMGEELSGGVRLVPEGAPPVGWLAGGREALSRTSPRLAARRVTPLQAI